MTVASRTIAQELRRCASAHPDVVGLRTPDDSVRLTWAEVLERSDGVARGLRRLGVGRGDAVALMLANRPEFHIADLAALTLGAVPFSIYQTLPPVQIEHLLRNSGARVAIVERAFLDQFLAATASVPELDQVVLLEGDDPRTIAWADVQNEGGADDLSESAAQGRPEDVVTLIYTSGTTGPSKGVELTHANVMADAVALQEVLRLEPGDRVISWLPTAHIAERMANYYVPVMNGLTITTCEDPGRIAAVLAAVKPHWFFAVPRVWEKLKTGVEAAVAGTPLEAALAGGDREALAPIRAKIGLDEAKCLNAGGGPSSPEVLEFFARLGAPVGELWGMSEVCGAATFSRPGDVRIGTVGPPLPGVEVRLADDGELLVRGPIVMRGYRGDPEKTAEALDADGWMHTGDLATVEDGHVRIVGRKKEIMVNAAGKNMSPANIEIAVKDQTPLIGHVCAIGDARPYVVALVVPDPEQARGRSRDELRVEIQRAVDAGNQLLARVEQIKRFHIIEDDWAPGGDELTPTMKLKRPVIQEKYAPEIEALYAAKQ